MGMLFRNWLDEGFYEEDSMGDLTRLTDPREIRRAEAEGTLFVHDGMGLSKATPEDIRIHEVKDNSLD
jgi:hypothetical protein